MSLANPTAPTPPVSGPAVDQSFAAQERARNEMVKWLVQTFLPVAIMACAFFIGLYVVQQSQAKDLANANAKIEQFQAAKETRIQQVAELQEQVRQLREEVTEVKVDVREGRQDIKILLQRVH